MFAKFFYKIYNVVFNGDCAMYDRFYWLKKNLVALNKDSKILDIGCGNGWALTLALKKGFFKAIGLSWSDIDINKNIKRSSKEIEFIKGDARKLDQIIFNTKFDAILNIENIEHIINAKKLIKDISNLLNEGGLLYLSTPNILHKRPYGDKLISSTPIEDGGHVVRGYSYQRLEKILLENDLNIIKVNYVTGKLSLFLYDIQTFLPSFRILKIFYIPLSMLFTRLDNLICSDNTHNHCIAIVAEKIKS
jgi:2-polyprenyl-3-methyl-5-hydroxy-6-metoxy-1,4-benzoquinol methylase|tara:strand:- start:1605 stop:2348 length:744 start_codon:yes stop_codon:yes gene_type:complete